MPNYTFKNKKTEEIFTITMKNSERELYLESNPDIEQMLISLNYVDPASVGRVKVPSDFNNLIKRIKKGNIGSTINSGNITEI